MHKENKLFALTISKEILLMERFSNACLLKGDVRLCKVPMVPLSSMESKDFLDAVIGFREVPSGKFKGLRESAKHMLEKLLGSGWERLFFVRLFTWKDVDGKRAALVLISKVPKSVNKGEYEVIELDIECLGPAFFIGYESSLREDLLLASFDVGGERVGISLSEFVRGKDIGKLLSMVRGSRKGTAGSRHPLVLS